MENEKIVNKNFNAVFYSNRALEYNTTVVEIVKLFKTAYQAKKFIKDNYSIDYMHMHNKYFSNKTMFCNLHMHTGQHADDFNVFYIVYFNDTSVYENSSKNRFELFVDEEEANDFVNLFYKDSDKKPCVREIELEEYDYNNKIVISNYSSAKIKGYEEKLRISAPEFILNFEFNHTIEKSMYLIYKKDNKKEMYIGNDKLFQFVHYMGINPVKYYTNKAEIEELFNRSNVKPSDLKDTIRVDHDTPLYLFMDEEKAYNQLKYLNSVKAYTNEDGEYVKFYMTEVNVIFNYDKTNDFSNCNYITFKNDIDGIYKGKRTHMNAYESLHIADMDSKFMNGGNTYKLYFEAKETLDKKRLNDKKSTLDRIINDDKKEVESLTKKELENKLKNKEYDNEKIRKRMNELEKNIHENKILREKLENGDEEALSKVKAGFENCDYDRYYYEVKSVRIIL